MTAKRRRSGRTPRKGRATGSTSTSTSTSSSGKRASPAKKQKTLSGGSKKTSSSTTSSSTSSSSSSSSSTNLPTRRLESVRCEAPNPYGSVHVMIIGDDGVGKKTLAAHLTVLEKEAQVPIHLKLSLRTRLDNPDRKNKERSGNGEEGEGEGEGEGEEGEKELRRVDVGRVDFVVLVASMVSGSSWDSVFGAIQNGLPLEYRMGRMVVVATHTDQKERYAVQNSVLTEVVDSAAVPMLYGSLIDNTDLAALSLNLFQRILTAYGPVGTSTAPLMDALARPSPLLIPPSSETFLPFDPESVYPTIPS